MSGQKEKSPVQGKKLETFIFGLGKIARYVLQISWHGLRRAVFGSIERSLVLGIFYGMLFILVYWHWTHLVTLNWLFPKVFTEDVVVFMVQHLSKCAQFWWLAGISTIVIGVVLGFVHFVRMAKYQGDLKHIGLKSAMGAEPKVIDVEQTSEFKKKITLVSHGVGLEQYKSKKSDFESTFGAIVENICVSERSRKLIEIHLAEKELRSFVSYQECVAALTEPYSFLVGESLGAILAQEIRSLPHLIIAGTSGNGKSVFLNQTMISLLRTSPHLQLYILDLKLGVEAKAYAQLPNARIAKDVDEAVQLLQAVVKEMKLRFQLLEKGAHKVIDPVRDGKDLIVVAIDEASVLYGKRRSGSKGNDMTMLARELTEEIAKLGRAAGIHLILATQKVTNESIDTKIQENVGGRVCFRVNSLQGSNTVLGNKKAYELPDVKGRAIWASGNNFTEVQTPFVSEPVIMSELKLIVAEFENGRRKCLQDMLRDGTAANQPDGPLNDLGKSST